jgi:hypothetical protein
MGFKIKSTRRAGGKLNGPKLFKTQRRRVGPAQLCVQRAVGQLTGGGPPVSGFTHPNRYGRMQAVGLEEDRAAVDRHRRRREGLLARRR